MEKANELMKYKNINKEELLLIPQDFPYVMKAIDFSDFRNCFVPWHWHNEIEIFYMKSGGIEYYLPGGRVSARRQSEFSRRNGRNYQFQRTA